MIILNEKEWAERCINGDISVDSPFKAIYVLAKYYYFALGYKKKKIREELNSFLAKHYDRYNSQIDSCQCTIEKIVKDIHKQKLYEINGVWITELELEKIESLNSPRLRRVSFTLLCLAKYAIEKNANSNGWVNLDRKDIFNMARVTCNRLERNRIIGELADRGFLELSRQVDNTSVRVTFINDDSEKLLFVDDFRELGYEYKLHVGGNYIRCASCGRLIKGNKNKTKKYCNDCAAYTPQETKIITCVDCGNEFEVNSLNVKSCRCKDCQKKYRNNYQRELMRKRRNNEC